MNLNPAMLSLRQRLAHHRERLRAYGLAVAFAIFIGGLAWAISSVPDLVTRLRWTPLPALLLIGAPLATVLNAVEIYVMSRIAGGPMKWRTAMEVTVYASAANMLPLPGGAMTRLAAMKAHGVSYRIGTSLTLLSFCVWGSLAFLYSAVALVLIGQARLSAGFALVGIASLLVSAVGFRQFGQWRLLGLIGLMRVVSFPIEAVRLMLAMLAVGATLGFLQSSALVVSSFIGASVSIVPAGLGVREGVIALLSPVVDVDPAVGFLAATTGRVMWMLGLALTAAVILSFHQRTGDTQ